MRICRALALAALIVAMPRNGMAQTQQLGPPVGGSGNLLEGREIDLLLSKPESLPGDGFDLWYRPKRVPPSDSSGLVTGGEVKQPSPRSDKAAGWPEPKRVPTIQVGQPSNGPRAPAGCEINWPSPAAACFGDVRRPDSRMKGPMGDFWWPGEFDRLIGPR